jgi:hypothetical protein
MNRTILLLSFLLLLTVVGCFNAGKGPSYADVKGKFARVKGTVNYNGKPVGKGQISFTIVGGPASTMDIVDGQFDGEAEVGTSRVMISAKKKADTIPNLDQEAKAKIEADKKVTFKGEPGKFRGAPLDWDPMMVEYIPPEWNTYSKNTRTIEAGATNEFAFDIKGTR